MRKNYTGNIVFCALLITAIGFVSCKDKPGKDIHAGHTDSTHTISRELVIDSSIISLAKPVNMQVVSHIRAIAPEPGTRIFSAEIRGQINYDTRNQTSISSRVAGRIERLYIKYNFQPVRRGQLILEIYSPDLAAAQREMLFIARSGDDENMLSKAKQRLSLLGMQPAQISQVLKTGQVIYRVPVYSNTSGYILERQANTTASNIPSPVPSTAKSADGMDGMSAGSGAGYIAAPSVSPTPVLIREGQYTGAGQSLFTIYSSESLVAEFALNAEIAAQIKKGQKLIFQTNSSPGKVFTGSIGLIQPVVRSGENFSVARVYIKNKELLPGQLVSAEIPVIYRGGWWLPKKAVWQSGNKSIVFKKQGTVYVPAAVQTIVEAEGMVLVKTSIGDWMVAENAWYLVDSESFIKTTDQPDK